MHPEPIIEIRKLKEINIEGGVVFDGFHGFGLTSTIAIGCFINSLKTELVGILDSTLFPPMSVIYNAKPHFPARIYANEEKKLAFFVSEAILESSAYRHIAHTMLNWSIYNKCKTVISVASREIEKDRTKKEPALYVISNSQNIMKELNNIGILSLKNGTVNGIPGILLNESTWKNIDVIVFVVDVISGVPDFRAAANVAQVVSKIVPEAYCEIKPLIKEAENIENNLKMIRSQTSNKFKERMYR